MDRKALAVGLVLLAVLPVMAYVAAWLLPGFAGYIVASNSMEPAIASGSLVYVVDTGDYEPGDAITFHRDGTVVTHRVVDETPRGYVTKGDANEAADSWRVSNGQVVGEVFLAVPLYGTLLGFAGTSTGYAVVAGLAALLLVGEIRTLLTEL